MASTRIHTGSAPPLPRSHESLDDAAQFASRCGPAVAPPRFEPDLSTEPGGLTTGNPGLSPNRTLTGWLPRTCARYAMTPPSKSKPSELLDARGSRLSGRGTIYVQESGSRSIQVLTGRQFNHHTLPDEPEEVVDPH